LAPPRKPSGAHRDNPVNCYVDDETLHRVDAIADSEGITRAGVLRRALLRDLRRHDDDRDRAAS
jgi:hypothetical protein